MIKDAQDFFIQDNDGWEIFYERILNNSFFLNIGSIHKKKLDFSDILSVKVVSNYIANSNKRYTLHSRWVNFSKKIIKTRGAILWTFAIQHHRS